MLSLGSGVGKSAKPSFVSYVTPEEMKITEKETSRKEKHPDLLPGEVEFCRASPVLKYNQDEHPQRGVFGTLLCTNFRISFVSDEDPAEEGQLFKNKLYGENDIPLTCVDHIYGAYDEKKKLMTGGSVRNKCPSKIIIHCKDLRVFQFSLTFAKEEDARKLFQGIIHHSLEPKSLKCVFAFSFCEKAMPASELPKTHRTVMFDSAEDWAHEMRRTKGICKVVSANENFSLSPKLPQFFIVPAALLDEDLSKFQGKGVPIWCWSHHSGCALFKMASLPLIQEDGFSQVHKMYYERMLNAVAQTHLFSVKTEELADTLPTIQDIQQSYSRFKHFFLIDNTTDFWMSDVKWFSSLEASGWLDIIRQCLQKAVEVVECLEKENTNVLIMEESGSDLCCLTSSLVQLMLDPYFRTLAGFQSLVQKEWVAGGHNFLDRCNHLQKKDKEFQAPVFLLFLECVWQLLQQHGPAFQFSETYLTVLSDSLYVPVFSTFLFNSPDHRATVTKAESPASQRGPLNFPSVWDWSLQFEHKAQELFTNPLYAEKPRLDKSLKKPHRGKHQRQLSLPSSAFKSTQKKGFFKEETDNLKKMLRVKRISRWLHSPDSAQASTREFYEAWQRKPLDYHGLVLPCLDGPAVRVWMQRYLRWLQQVQIFGGGAIAVMSKLADLAGEVQELQRELELQTCQTDSNHQGEPEHQASQMGHQRADGSSRLSSRLSSSFPFATPRVWSSKPSIPTSLLHRLMISGNMAEQDDEDMETLGIV
ncbi:hypothetical protein GJAV_G00023020 [Gymnothorax javanicus]|nr:hypothetical protein GJAV_G00023020 [Gymnothorax javanicus]